MAEAGSEKAGSPQALTASDLDRLRIDRTSSRARRRRRRTPWIVAGVLVAAGAALVWTTMGEELFAPRVRTARVLRVPPTDGVVRTSASGYVVPRRRAAISSRMSGRLEKLTVDVDDRVEAGQVLGELGHADLDAAVLEAGAAVEVRRAEIETARRDAASRSATADTAKVRLAEPEAMLHEMESRLADAERTLEREQKLKPGVATTQESLDRATMERDVAARRIDQTRAQAETLRATARQAVLEIEAAEARVTTAQASLAAAEAAVLHAKAMRADADIVAPFAGRVLRKEAEIGEMVAPVNAAGGTTRGAIVTLADFSSLEMEVDVIERDIGLVEPGSPCRIVLDFRRDHPYAGTVRQIVPTADRTKSTVQVKIGFRSLDERVFPEMSGRVEFLKSGVPDSAALGADRVFAPETAFVARDGSRGVFEVKDGRAVFRVAAAAASPAAKQGLLEVASGLAGGEDVIVDPPAHLVDGALVRVAEPGK